jgi:2-oxoglutarate ferredoxin oxidoreductase subunit gamma
MASRGEKEILITGFGGQGIILTGNILGTAAALHAGKHATMTQSYGPEARGGSCSAQVIISEREILFPYVEAPQVLICMSQEGYTKNLKLLAPGGLLIWDTDLVKTDSLDPSWLIYHIPATRIAEQLGNKMMANIVMLGFLAAVSDVVPASALKAAVLGAVPPKTREANEKAFERGYEYGEEIVKGRTKQHKLKGPAPE